MEDNYPTEEELQKIEAWDCLTPQGAAACMQFVASLWMWPDWGWKEEAKNDGELWYYISTGGWSGNESLISAMEKNQFLWIHAWYSSRVGGHYEFRLKVL